MRNSALSAFLFAMALVAVAVINPNRAFAGLMPEFLMSEEACLARGEPPEFCAYLAEPAVTEGDTDTEAVTESEAKAEEPTVWIPRPAIPVWREVPLSQVPAPEVPTGPDAGNMIIWDFDAGSCADPRLSHTGREAREMAAQDAAVLRSLSATLALAQADMAWSLTEAGQTSWLYGDAYGESLGTLTGMSVELAGEIARLDRLVVSFPDTDKSLHGRQARRALRLCQEQGDLLNGYSGLWIDVATVAASITKARLDAGVTVAPWRADPYGELDRQAVQAQLVGLNALIPAPAECLDELDRQLRDRGIGDCVDK